MVVYNCNPITWNTEARGLKIATQNTEVRNQHLSSSPALERPRPTDPKCCLFFLHLNSVECYTLCQWYHFSYHLPDWVPQEPPLPLSLAIRGFPQVQSQNTVHPISHKLQLNEAKDLKPSSKVKSINGLPTTSLGQNTFLWAFHLSLGTSWSFIYPTLALKPMHSQRTPHNCSFIYPTHLSPQLSNFNTRL